MILPLGKVLIVLYLVTAIRCDENDDSFDQVLCKNCEERVVLPRIGGKKVETRGQSFRYAASIYRKGIYNVKNEHDVQVDRGTNYSILCSAVIVNPNHVLTSYTC